MEHYINQILAIILTCVIIYIFTSLHNYYIRYKFFKKQYFDSKNTNAKSKFRDLLDKQMEDAQRQRKEMLDKKNKL